MAKNLPTVCRHLKYSAYLNSHRYGKSPKISNTKISDEMAYANSAYPDQTAPSCLLLKEQSDQDLLCLPFH